MKDQIYLSDYVLRIDGSFNPSYSASFKDSFLFLADFIGVNTDHEFAYVHYSMVANHCTDLYVADPLTKEQDAKLDVLVNCDPLVLDILCTIARFQTFDCSPSEIKRITYELKGHLGDKVKEAEKLSLNILGIDLSSSSSPLDFSPPVSEEVFYPSNPNSYSPHTNNTI